MFKRKAMIKPGSLKLHLFQAIESKLKSGIDQENAKKITKLIRDQGPKSAKAQIQGDELRVSSKSRDDLQEIIALLKGADLPVDLQFVNYR